jgi:hypothetical protein
VHIHKPEEVQQASDILNAHHGHRIEQFGHRAGVTEITSY